MKEDLSEPYPGYGFGTLDAFDGYVSYRLMDEQALAGEIADMREIIDRTADDLVITQDLGLGMMLWMTQFFPQEWWAEIQKGRSLAMLAACGWKRVISRPSGDEYDHAAITHVMACNSHFPGLLLRQ
jgi:ABC-type thiamine transport system substrate-binding protein